MNKNKEKIAPIKKHNKEDYEAKCPNCGSEDISDVEGWCYNHGNPTFDGDRRFCDNKECGFIISIKGAYFCNDCDTLYDNKYMTNWNWGNVWYATCPVGEEYEETPEEYSEKLLSFLVKYEETKVDECLNKGYYLEAIGTLHIRISEQLRFLLIKKVKGHENIPLDYNDERFKKVVEWVKDLRDYDLYRISYIFNRINKEELGDLNGFNKLRNRFSHSFSKRELYSEKQIKGIINKVKEIERRLTEEVKTYGLINNL